MLRIEGIVLSITSEASVMVASGVCDVDPGGLSCGEPYPKIG